MSEKRHSLFPVKERRFSKMELQRMKKSTADERRQRAEALQDLILEIMDKLNIKRDPSPQITNSLVLDLHGYVENFCKGYYGVLDLQDPPPEYTSSIYEAHDVPNLQGSTRQGLELQRCLASMGSFLRLVHAALGNNLPTDIIIQQEHVDKFRQVVEEKIHPKTNDLVRLQHTLGEFKRIPIPLLMSIFDPDVDFWEMSYEMPELDQRRITVEAARLNRDCQLPSVTYLTSIEADTLLLQGNQVCNPLFGNTSNTFPSGLSDEEVLETIRAQLYAYKRRIGAALFYLDPAIEYQGDVRGILQYATDAAADFLVSQSKLYELYKDKEFLTPTGIEYYAHLLSIPPLRTSQYASILEKRETLSIFYKQYTPMIIALANMLRV